MPRRSKLYPFMFYTPIYSMPVYILVECGKGHLAAAPMVEDPTAVLLLMLWCALVFWGAFCALVDFFRLEKCGFTDLKLYLTWIKADPK